MRLLNTTGTLNFKELYMKGSAYQKIMELGKNPETKLASQCAYNSLKEAAQYKDILITANGNKYEVKEIDPSTMQTIGTITSSDDMTRTLDMAAKLIKMEISQNPKVAKMGKKRGINTKI